MLLALLLIAIPHQTSLADPPAQLCGPVPSADLVLMIDRSGSVNEADEFNVLRSAAKEILNLFLDSTPHPRIALGSFRVRTGIPPALIESDGDGFTAHLTGDYGIDGVPGTRLFKILNEMPTPNGGRTDISAAIATAQAELEANALSLNRYIILISDGIATEPGCLGSCFCPSSMEATNAAADAAEAAGTKIMVARYGDLDYCPAPFTIDFIREQLCTFPEYLYELPGAGGGLDGLFEAITNYPPCNDQDECTIDTCNPNSGYCEFSAPDSDGDGVFDCHDGCPNDPNKTSPGQCGCGVSETDSDSDGTPNCLDQCPLDPQKTDPGVCGCGIPDQDSDSDGKLNCQDGCPFDAAKVTPGACGCGVPDIDSDGDGALSCQEQCPFDPLKLVPGICGCGTSDRDRDADGTADCNDQCPLDSNKIIPETCGCGAEETDSDTDGTPDCIDQCPLDQLKLSPGACGCAASDTDSDGDTTPDCLDQCPSDPAKTQPGVCGCGTSDADENNDGYADCQCTSYQVRQEAGDLYIGPEALRLYARKTMARLVKNAMKTNPGLGARLRRSAKNADPKMRKLIKRSTQTLDQLPQIMLICPNSPLCSSVDNTAQIQVYIESVQQLGNMVVRLLNRATRLPLGLPLTQVRARTQEYGRTIKATTSSLLNKVQQIPKSSSYCAAG